MKFAEFIKYLVLTTVVTLLIYYLLKLFLPLGSTVGFLWGSIIGFVVLSILIYLLVERSLAVSKGRNMLGLVVFNVLLKLAFSFGFVAFYVQNNQPQNKLFLLPFFIAYLTFTIFETYFLNLQARASK